MEKLPEELQRYLDTLSREYANQLPQRVVAILEAWAEWQQGHQHQEALVELHRQIHSLAGSASSFGLPEVSRLAGRADALMRPLMEAHTTSCETLDAIGAILESLRRIAMGDPEHPPTA